MNPDSIKAFERTIRRKYNNITGILVQKDGETRYERYFHGFAAEHAVHVYSVTKSIVSALIGIALEKGYLKSVEQNVLDFFPDYPVLPGEKTIQNVTIQHLLTMTAPYKYKTEPYMQFFTSQNPIQDALDLLGGDAAKLPGLFKNQPVDFGGGHARLDVRRHMVKHGDVDLAAFADAHDLFGRFEDASGRDKVPLMGVFGDPGVVWRACGLAFAASAPAWRLAVSFLIHVFLRSLWAVRGRGAQQKEIPHKKRAKHTPPGPHCRIRAEEAVFKLTYQGIVI